ncbi:MAG TPA: hypothetical protein VJP86_00445, partial [Vicinamibacterales bacterium]|nr:hypothetical protein [Vicinamibacterales bacterium]
YDIVGLSALLPAAALGGGYAFEPAELDGRAPSALDVYVAFSRYGQRGEITQLYGEGNAAGRVLSDPLI